MILNGKTDVSIEVRNEHILEAAAMLVLNMADLRECDFISDDKIMYRDNDDYGNPLVVKRKVKDGDEEAIKMAIYLNKLSEKLWQERYDREHNR